MSTSLARSVHREVIAIPVSREDIADYLGLAIETVSRTFGVLERNGVIALAGSRSIILTDRLALENLAKGIVEK